MKQLFCLLFLIMISCQDSHQIKEIEILTYFTNARDFRVYSTTNKSGFTQTLFKPESSQYIDHCQSRIPKSLIDSIVSICKDGKDENFIFKSKKNIIYCGYWHSVRVTYENGEKLMFAYPYANEQNKQFFPFQSLSKQIQNDSLKATRIDIGQLGRLYLKQEDLSKVTFEKDSIFFHKLFKVNHN